MNWMLPCTDELQTMDKVSIYLSLFPQWIMQSCCKVFATGQNQEEASKLSGFENLKP